MSRRGLNKISKAHAQRLVEQFREAYPEIFETYQSYSQRAELEAKQRELESREKSYQAQRKALHLDTLRTMCDLYSNFGQMMQVLGRAMESEKDQL